MTEKHTFYVPDGLSEGGVVAFPESEAHHAGRVLRLKPGNVVTAVDGAGTRARLTLMEVERRGVIARCLEVRSEPRAVPVRITLAASLLAKPARFETLLEKAAEIGVDRVIPVRTDRTEARRFRQDRAETILLSALKQSGSAHRTWLDPETPLSTVLQERGSTRILLHESASEADHLGRMTFGERVTLFVGPEGGFSDEEVALAVSEGVRPGYLGPKRLRAETAGIVGAAFVALSYRNPDPAR